MNAVAALFSGFVAGAAVGVFALGLLGAMLVNVPTSNWLRQRFPDPSNWVMVSLGAALVGQAGCAVLGMLLGAALLSIKESSANGIGSPSWQYTLGVILCLVLLDLAAIYWQPARARRFSLVALLAAGCYGWMLPHLATA